MLSLLIYENDAEFCRAHQGPAAIPSSKVLVIINTMIRNNETWNAETLQTA
ncbi:MULTISPECIES: hypothetical protein [Ochrobactrum]|uniref:Uncharacterized protein n=1 Tax=Ochrobactrum chromiisoli TaxID=2993941 RepID=A0ABT3QUJ5_9HYPH|nr:hypothetical protein [Ochrobactrum chromiisoli]MCH4543926.1 hypothetical protein [Ochrobactrum sp. A-1]MCX2699309.1 hypothetical protein [Ochrobactrum chromiisoli]